MKDLIGRKIKGFKFKDSYIEYPDQMDKHIGEVGKITDIVCNSVKVVFKDNYWYYPLDQIQPHLIPETTTALNMSNKSYFIIFLTAFILTYCAVIGLIYSML